MADNPLMRPGRIAPESDHGFTRPMGKLTVGDLETYAAELNKRRMSHIMGWHWHVSVNSENGDRFLDRTSAEVLEYKRKKAARA